MLGMQELSARTRMQWAEDTFGGSPLPDARLRARLKQYAAAQMAAPEASTAAACVSIAEREGAYRLLENERVLASDIIQGPIEQTLRRCQGKRRILAIQDSSSVEVKHQALREALQEPGSPTGWHVHVALAVDGARREPLGPLALAHWVRDPQHERAQKRAQGTATKESDRWQQTAEQMHQAFADSDTEVVTVADREADIYALLAYHQEAEQSYVIRAKHARQVRERDPMVGTVFEAVERQPALGTRRVQVAQRGGQKAGGGQSARAARSAVDVDTEVRACSVTVARPAQAERSLADSVTVTVVQARSAACDAQGKPLLHWVLLCRQPVTTLAEACEVIAMYECRWLIEELFRGWKTGFRLEERPLQSMGAVARMMAMTLPMAVNLLRLRVLRELKGQTHSCTVVLDDDQWRCLWLHTEGGSPVPAQAPDCHWAYLALAKLGGFYDSKRTGRAGWQALWKGLGKLNDFVVGFRLAQLQAPGVEL